MKFRRRTNLGTVVALSSLLFMDTDGVYEAVLINELQCYPNERNVES